MAERKSTTDGVGYTILSIKKNWGLIFCYHIFHSSMNCWLSHVRLLIPNRSMPVKFINKCVSNSRLKSSEKYFYLNCNWGLEIAGSWKAIFFVNTSVFSFLFVLQKNGFSVELCLSFGDRGRSATIPTHFLVPVSIFKVCPNSSFNHLSAVFLLKDNRFLNDEKDFFKLAFFLV